MTGQRGWRATTLERLAHRQWEESRRARRPRAQALAATARQLNGEAQRLAARHLNSFRRVA